jgi:hypothetical protein
MLKGSLYLQTQSKTPQSLAFLTRSNPMKVRTLKLTHSQINIATNVVGSSSRTRT